MSHGDEVISYNDLDELQQVANEYVVGDTDELPEG
jgi:hypothetical protein